MNNQEFYKQKIKETRKSNADFLWDQFHSSSFLPNKEVSEGQVEKALLDADRALANLIDDLLNLERRYPHADLVQDTITDEVILVIRRFVDAHENRFYDENFFDGSDYSEALAKHLKSILYPDYSQWAENYCGKVESYNSPEHYKQTKELFEKGTALIQTSFIEGRLNWLGYRGNQVLII